MNQKPSQARDAISITFGRVDLLSARKSRALDKMYILYATIRLSFIWLDLACVGWLTIYGLSHYLSVAM
jgi:hypothetical protein